MKKAKHYRKSNLDGKKIAASVAMTAALAVSANVTALAVEADESAEFTDPAQTEESLPAAAETNNSAENGGNSESTENTANPESAADAEQTEEAEDTRTDEEKHKDNQTIAEETNPEHIDSNQEIIEGLPALGEGSDETDEGSEEAGEGNTQQEITDTLEQTGDDIKNFELPELPEAPSVDGLPAEEAEALKAAYEAAVEEYNRLIGSEDGYNANVDAYNAALAQLKGLIGQNNQQVQENAADAAGENQEKVEENEKTIQGNQNIVEENEGKIEGNETGDQLDTQEKAVEDAGAKLDPDQLDALTEAKKQLESIKTSIAALDTSSMSAEETAEANRLLEEYEKAVHAYEEAVSAYNEDVSEYKSAVNAYNAALVSYITAYNKGVVDSNDTTIDSNHGQESMESSGTIGNNETTMAGNQEAAGAVEGEEVDAGSAGRITISADGVVTITEGEKTYTLKLDETVSSDAVAEALDALQKITVPTMENLEGNSAEEIKEIVEAYNAAVASYNEAVASYNDDLETYHAAVEAYESALAAYNSVIEAKNSTIESTNQAIIGGNTTTIAGNKTDTGNLTASGNTILGNQSIRNSETSYAEISQDGTTVTIQNGTDTYTLTAGANGTLTITTPDGAVVSLSEKVIRKVADGVTFTSGTTSLEAYNQAVQQYIAAVETYNTENVADYNAFVNAYNQAMAAYQAVVNEANASVKEDNAGVLETGGTLDTILEFNDKSTAIVQGTGKEYTVKKADGTETTKTIDDGAKEYEALKNAVTAAQEALKNAGYDLTTQENIDNYNKLIAAYNLAAENYNSFVKVCNSAASDSSAPDVEPVEISNLPLYVATDTKVSQFFLVKDSTVPDEDGSKEYTASGYTAHGELNGSVLVGTMNIDDLVFGNGSGRVEVTNMYTRLSEDELPEGFDSSNTYFKDNDGNYYVINGGKYLTSIAETGKWGGVIGFGTDGMYRYKYVDGKLYVISTGGGKETYATGVKNGYISAYTPNSQNIIVQTEFNTSKFNFTSEEALSDYFKNVGILVDGGASPDSDQMKAVIQKYFGETISKAYEDGLIGAQWYVVKDNNTGAKDGHTHVDGALYWKNTLEVVDQSKMSTLGTLTLVKNLPASAGGANVLTKTLNTKKQPLSVTLGSLTELAPLTGGGNADQADTWKDALGYQTLTPASPIVSPNDELTVPTGSFIATEELEALEPLTPIEGDVIVIKPTDPVVIIPVITPGDGELIQEIVKEITPQLPELLEQGEVSADAAVVEETQDKLPQTGQNWALTGLLGALGALLVSAGLLSEKRRKNENEA